MIAASMSLATPPPSPRSDYARIERAIRYLREHAREQPSLAEVAAAAGLSEFHFQRLFQRWAGVSPKRFLQVLTLTEAKRLLEDSRSVLEASVEVGLSGPGRLHDLFLSIERMTPGEYKDRGRGLEMTWSVEQTPLGEALLVANPRGLCAISFVDGGVEPALDEVRARWPEAAFAHRPQALREAAGELRRRMAGETGRPLGIVLKGTPLQLRVWEALLRIPSGRVASYAEVARLAERPGAVRAVASAVAANPLGYLIPCHRVIRSTGALGEYHWGSDRKLALIALERARAEPASAAI